VGAARPRPAASARSHRMESRVTADRAARPPHRPAWPRLVRAAVLAMALAPVAARAVERIEKIELLGNEFLSREAFLALTDLEVGDVYDEQALQREYRKVWETGLFEDLLLESAPGAEPDGKVVIWTVSEKPRIDSVTYETVKAFTQQRLEEVLKENDAAISTSSTLDEEKVSRTRRLVEELLAAEGYPEARVTVVQRRIGRSRVALEFKMDPGPKMKIEDILFTGNTVFTQRELQGFLKMTKEKGLFTSWSNKTTYYRQRLEEDLQEIRDAYRAKGHIQAEVGEPKVQDARAGKSGKEERRLVRLVIPIEEGPRFALGKLTLTGNTVFPTAELRQLIPLAEGEVLNDSLLKLGISRIDNRYGDAGYLYAVSSPRYSPDPKRLAADVDVQVTENDRYSIRRIEFDGNVRTKDEVLRREMRLQEGDTFSRRDFHVGLRKLAQLGYWELEAEPTITPADTGKPEVDITVRGSEVGRNEIQFGGGFSGVDGFFATFSFQSRNFMGRGSQLSVSGQIGGETTRYAISYVEPYFLKTRGTLGASIYARDQDYDGYDREGKGASVFWAYPTSTFSAFRVSARWDDSEIIGEGNVEDDRFITYALTPSWAFDNRDNPFRPTRGRRLSTSMELGASRDEQTDFINPDYVDGTVNFVKPEVGITQYFRTARKQYFGIHAETGLLEPTGGGALDPVPEDGIDRPYLPVFERYFLGGEQSIRGVETRSVGPRLIHTSPGGIELEDVAIGGDAYYLVNVEYNWPLSKIFEASLFLDMGNAFGVNHVDTDSLVDAEDQDVLEIVDSDPFDVKATAGIEMRFHTPVLQQPLRLIYGCKVFGDFLDDESTCSFQFSIGRTFQ
jgi:outer membrane protein insertion porin family